MIVVILIIIFLLGCSAEKKGSAHLLLDIETLPIDNSSHKNPHIVSRLHKDCPKEIEYIVIEKESKKVSKAKSTGKKKK